MTIDSLSTYESLSTIPYHGDQQPIHQQHSTSKGFGCHDSLEVRTPETAPSYWQRIRTSTPKVLGAGAKILVGTLIVSGGLYTLSLGALRLSSTLLSLSMKQTGRIANSLRQSSHLFAAASLWTQKIGKGLFLTVTVPPYMICYQFPKWFFTVQLPLALNTLMRWLKVFNDIVVKIARNIGVKLAKVVDVLAQAVERCAALLKKVIKPILDVAKIAWNLIVKGWLFLGRVTVNVVRKIADGILWISHKVAPIARFCMRGVRAVGRKVYAVFNWVNRRILKPVISIINRGIYRSFVWFKRILHPVFRLISVNAQRLSAMISKTVITLWNFVGQCAHSVGRKISFAAKWSLHLIQRTANTLMAWIAPPFRFLGNQLQKTWNSIAYVASRLSRLIAGGWRLTTNTFHTITAAATKGFRWIGSKVRPIVNAVWSTISRVAQWVTPKITTAARSVGRIISKTVNLLAEGAFRVKNAISFGSGQLRKALRRATRYVSFYAHAASNTLMRILKNWQKQIVSATEEFWKFCRRLLPVK